MKTTSLAQSWETFASQFPTDVSPALYENLRRAFYAGAHNALVSIQEAANQKRFGALSALFDECRRVVDTEMNGTSIS